jgi:hypothetical protein
MYQAQPADRKYWNNNVMLHGDTCASAFEITCFEASLHMFTRGFVQDHGDENRSVFLINKRNRPIFTASIMGWSVFNPDRKAMAQSPFFSRPAFCQSADVPKERFLSI